VISKSFSCKDNIINFIVYNIPAKTIKTITQKCHCKVEIKFQNLYVKSKEKTGQNASRITFVRATGQSRITWRRVTNVAAYLKICFPETVRFAFFIFRYIQLHRSEINTCYRRRRFFRKLLRKSERLRRRRNARECLPAVIFVVRGRNRNGGRRDLRSMRRVGNERKK